MDKETHKGVSELKKHLTEFLGLKEQAHKYGIGGFSLKLFRLAKTPAGKCEEWAVGKCGRQRAAAGGSGRQRAAAGGSGQTRRMGSGLTQRR